jgi:hypothetical protein
MNLKLHIDKHEYPVVGFSMSLIMHALIFTIAALILNSSIEETRVGSPYVQIRTIEAQPDLQPVKPNEKTDSETQEITEKRNLPIENEQLPKKQSELNNPTSLFYDFSDSPADTSDLVQVYKESTLDVSLKYPAGWTYIDQNLKNTLDGVTFWTTSTRFNPPPYVHIEVKDKELFNPNRFKHSYKTRNYTAYYNEPEELEGQITQIIYIRTDTEKDFSLKLIMKGEEAFKSFQPVFFGMVKSFKYGNQFF